MMWKESGTKRTAMIERLEQRSLLSVTADPSIPFQNVNISRATQNQSEGVIAIDRTTPGRLFAASNTEDGDAGLFASRSSDSGTTWNGGTIASGTDDLEPACCDPTAAFDSFGNLYLGYINSDQNSVEIIISTDGGATFSPLTSFPGDVDQPTLTTGPGSLWITFTKGNRIVAAGAPVTGLGAVGDFGKEQSISGSTSGSFGDIAVGADGQVAVTWQKGGGGKGKVGVNVDPDGLGPLPFSKAVTAANIRVGLFDKVPAQPDRGIDAEAGLAFDRSSGPFRGRLYLVYTDSAPKSRVNTDIFIRYSDNNGATWSNAIRVNSDSGLQDQILPRIAADDTTGHIAVSWHDSRDDPGATAGTAQASLSTAKKTAGRMSPAREEHDNPHDKDDQDTGPISPGPDVPKDEVTFYAAVGVPTATGVNLSNDSRLSVGGTAAADSGNGIELGDYTGLDFHDGVFHPIWADNSNSTSDNPDGAGMDLDMYTTAVAEADMPATTRIGFGGLVTNGGPVPVLAAKQYPALTKGGRLTYKITWTDADKVDAATLDGTELTVAGPAGVNVGVTLVKAKAGKRGTVSATYVIAPVGRLFTSADDGVYSITLADAKVKDTLGNTTPGGIIGDFVVDMK